MLAGLARVLLLLLLLVVAVAYVVVATSSDVGHTRSRTPIRVVSNNKGAGYGSTGGKWDEMRRGKRQSTPRDCPNQCQSQLGHGHCGPDSTCLCNDPWGGDDCSIQVLPLRPEANAVSSAEASSWRYFVTDLLPGKHGQTITWEVSSTEGDCDLYVQHDHTPSRIDYFARDIGTSVYFVLQVINNSSAKWYAGLYAYGWKPCYFNISVAVTGGSTSKCRNDCSGRGQCIAGICQCSPGWGSDDCSIPIVQMNMGRPLVDTAYPYVWKYYSTPVSYNTINLSLNLTGSTYMPDVYIKFNSLPNSTFYDDFTSSTSRTIMMEVAAPKNASIIYIGVRASLDRASYTMLLTEHNECPSQCSRHGQCQQLTTCRCSAQFSGTDCEYMTSALPYDQPTPGYVTDDVWNYYFFTATTINAITVAVDQADGDPNADCDLYIRSGSYPTLFQYDYADTTYSPHMVISIREPQFNTWYIGVYGKKKCAYDVRQAIATSCSGCDAPYGTCTPEKTCLCSPGWAGPTCRIAVLPLATGQTVSGSLSRNQWSYYSFNLTGSVATASLIEVEPWARGYYWLFVGLQLVPDLEHADYSDRESNTNFHEIDITSPNPVQLYVGVYGSPFDHSGSQQTAHYALSVWQSPF